MAIFKYTLYKYVKVDGIWRYCKALYHGNCKIKPDIVFVNVKQGLLKSLGVSKLLEKPTYHEKRLSPTQTTNSPCSTAPMPRRPSCSTSSLEAWRETMRRTAVG